MSESVILSSEHLLKFRQFLFSAEKSSATMEKYLREAHRFFNHLHGEALSRESVVSYKSALQAESYETRTVNSMLTGLNAFLSFLGKGEWKARLIRVQKRVFCPEEKELSRPEYERLIRAARQKKNERLSLLIQTIAGTGIRVSELQFITVEAAGRGEATVLLKGKNRSVLIVKSLREKLLRYASQHSILSGPIFVTRSGKPLHRSNVWHEMKSLCRDAAVSPEKVFPHNLRHLFARIFYGLEKDLAKLADVLGHSSIETTRIYVISSGKEHRKKLERMGLVLRE